MDEKLKCGILNVGCTDNSKMLSSEAGKGVSIAIGKLEELVKVSHTIYYKFYRVESLIVFLQDW